MISSGRTNFMPGLPFENKNAGLDNVVTPFGSWASVGINQQVLLSFMRFHFSFSFSFFVCAVVSL